MRIKLCCLSCGHSLDLGDAYENYRGAVRCWSCRALLNITLEEGLLKEMQPTPSTVAEARWDGGDPASRQES